ncbi:MAG: ATP-binding protein [Burkholderiales bacterium]
MIAIENVRLFRELEEKTRQLEIASAHKSAFLANMQHELRARAANGSVEIAVADTGIGIPADRLERVFEELEQVDGTSRREHGGTGLGLAIARRLARLMGGDIRKESTPDVGSTFALSLPQRYRSSQT